MKLEALARLVHVGSADLMTLRALRQASNRFRRARITSLRQFITKSRCRKSKSGMKKKKKEDDQAKLSLIFVSEDFAR